MNMEGDDSSFLASRTFLFLPHSSQKKMMDLTIMPAGTRTEAPNTILGILINLPPPPHENRPKNEAENTTGPWTCVPCADDNGPVQFDTYYKYRRHLKEDHKKLIDVRICEHCGFKAYQINHHFYHLYTEHNIAPPLNYDFPKCDQCNYIGLCQKRLDTHRISKHTGTVTKKRKENKTIHLPQDMTSLTETPTVPSSSDHDHTYAKIMKINGRVNAGTPISIISSVDATPQTDAESPAKIVQTLVSDRADLDEDNQEESQDGDDESEKKPSGPTIELEDSASSRVRGSRPLLEDLALGVPPTPSSHCPISIRNGSSSVPGTSRQQGSGSSGKASEVVDLTRDESGDYFKRRTRRTHIPVKPYQPRVADDDEAVKIAVGRKLPHVNSPECKLSHNCDVSPEQSVRIVEMNGSSSVPGTSRQQGSGSSGKASEVVDLTRDESGDYFKRRTHIPVKPYQPRAADDDEAVKIAVGRKLPHVNSPECKLSHNCDVSPEQSVRIVEIQRKDGEKEREMKRQVEEEALKKEPYPKHIEAIDERIRRHVKITDVVLDDTEPEEVALPELTDDMQAKISAALRPNPPREELVEGFGQKITRTDIQTLNKLNWLNDEVINFYMNLIIERGKGDKYLSVYAFNTFFYPKLEKQGYSTLRRWTKKVDIFNHKLLLVPIHLGNHWCMATIDFRDKTVRYYDSMGGENNKCLNALLKYLNDESMDKKKASYDTSGWILINMKDIPQQMNGSDCGMFSCMFAEYASRNAKITFSQKDMPYFRNKMVFEILSKKLLF